MKSILKKIRLPRKIMFVIAGVLVLSGASGAFAVYSGKEMIFGKQDEAKAPTVSGVACTTLDTLKMRRNGQRWIRKYISTQSASGEERVQTALRVAGLLVKAEKADLYQVAVLDAAGPSDRADRRGAAIGAEVLFAPDPTKLPGMTQPFVARYNDADANSVGMFYGKEIDLETLAIKDMMTAMVDRSDCFDPVAAAAATAHAAEGSESGHGAPAAHGDEAAEGHEPAAGEGEAAGGHNEAAPASEHGAEASSEHTEPTEKGHGEAAAAHEAAPSAEKSKAESKGFIESMMAMVFGSGDASAQAEHAATSEVTPHGEEAASQNKAADFHAHDAAMPDHATEPSTAEHVPVTAPVDHGETAAEKVEDGGDHAAAPASHDEPAQQAAEAAHEQPEPAAH